MVNMEDRLNSAQSTPQTYHASSSGHAQNTSDTISSETLHQMCYPPRQSQDPITQTTTYPYNSNPVYSLQPQFNYVNQEIP